MLLGDVLVKKKFVEKNQAQDVCLIKREVVTETRSSQGEELMGNFAVYRRLSYKRKRTYCCS
jgi:hypothetical protein